MPPATDDADARALALVHQGWNHLQLQRPQAAWASWQRALRTVPEFPAAQQALETLKSAGELPAAARAVYRFQPPQGEAARLRWNERLQEGGLEDLGLAVMAFERLADEDQGDAAAAYNQGLCLAWLGRNREAIEAIARAVHRLAGTDFDRAVDAWTLAEVLRQGAGAETLADDLNYSWTIEPAGPEVLERLAAALTLVPVPAPQGPIAEALSSDIRIFECLDRPLLANSAADCAVAELPRLLATVVQTPRTLRLSSPLAGALEALEDELTRALGSHPGAIRREATPLSFPLLDAALWTFRLPGGLNPGALQRLTREAVESFYENRWIHIPRNGLDGSAPKGAALTAKGDAVSRAKLTAIVRLREQLAARTRAAPLYLGYPFDRLRRRLGLEPSDPAAVDPLDATCMSGAELDGLDPDALDDPLLVDAFESAAGLRDDARTARFAAVMTRRSSSSSSVVRNGP